MNDKLKMLPSNLSPRQGNRYGRHRHSVSNPSPVKSSHSIITTGKQLSFYLSQAPILLPKVLPVLPKQLSRVSSFLARKRSVPKRPPVTLSHLKFPKEFTLHATATATGTVMGQPKPHNQDRAFAVTDKDFAVFAVCDGHGTYGHRVSQFLREFVPTALKPPQHNADWLYQLKSVIDQATARAIHSDIDMSTSGSTLNAVVLTDSYAYCANVGDSRAVLARAELGWTAVPLSTDHKPDDPVEQRRIRMLGGVISQSRPAGPHRVWLKNSQLPGLAMSRSIGDTALKAVGVIPEPTFAKVPLTPADKFIVLATDGVWEVLSSAEVVMLAQDGWERGSAQVACTAILQEAEKRWGRLAGNTDDITVTVIVIHPR